MNTCEGQHICCDICDGIKNDPNTGWGGFRDHYARKDFKTTKEQEEYYKDAKKQGKTGKYDPDEE